MASFAGFNADELTTVHSYTIDPAVRLDILPEPSPGRRVCRTLRSTIGCEERQPL